MIDSQKTYSISDLAKEFDVTTRSIRFYEDQSLIKPSRRGQTRIYSPQDRVRLKLILRGKRLGFSLAETRRLFDLYDADRSSVQQLHTMLNLIEVIEKSHVVDNAVKRIRAVHIDSQPALAARHFLFEL